MAFPFVLSFWEGLDRLSRKFEARSSTVNMKEKKFGISGSTLKWIAIITMLIDHIGASILTKQLLYMNMHPQAFGGVTAEFVEQFNNLYFVMRVTRKIGRLAFPIFCFLLVEGFLRTKNLKKYMLRMALFALLTEVPFDLVFTGTPVYWGYQNVMVTLFIALLTMWGCKVVVGYALSFFEKSQKGKAWILPTIILIYAAYTVAGSLIADLVQCDYGGKGVAPIMLIYFLRFYKPAQMLGGAASFYWELPAPASFLPIWLYNGERGMKMKYFFYAFYPVHLLILYLICVMMGLGNIAVV